MKRIHNAIDVIDAFKSAKHCRNLVEGMFPAKGLVSIVGPSDSGKSLISRYLAIAVARGDENFIGRELSTRSRGVLFGSTEDSIEDTGELLLRQSELEDREPWSGWLNNMSFIFEPDDLLRQIENHLTQIPCDLVVVDCFGDAFNGSDLNSTTQIRRYLQSFKDISDRFNSLILFVHHNSKRSASNGPDKGNILGGQGYEGKMRVIIEVVEDQNSDHIYHLCFTKANRMSKAQKKTSIAIRLNPETLTYASDASTSHYDSNIKDLKPKTKKGREKSLKDDPAFQEKARRLLYVEKLPYTSAAEALTAKGYPVGKSSLNNWFPAQQ